MQICLTLGYCACGGTPPTEEASGKANFLWRREERQSCITSLLEGKIPPRGRAVEEEGAPSVTAILSGRE
jgi:hypothetical protein